MSLFLPTNLSTNIDVRRASDEVMNLSSSRWQLGRTFVRQSKCLIARDVARHFHGIPIFAQPQSYGLQRSRYEVNNGPAGWRRWQTSVVVAEIEAETEQSYISEQSLSHSHGNGKSNRALAQDESNNLQRGPQPQQASPKNESTQDVNENKAQSIPQITIRSTGLILRLLYIT